MAGRTRLVGLRIEPVDGSDGGEGVISAEWLRGFPVRRALAAAVETLAADAAAEWTEVEREPGKALPAEHFEFVATAYATAVELGRAPSAFICDSWQVSRATAHSWIREARHLGLIDDSDEKGRGE